MPRGRLGGVQVNKLELVLNIETLRGIAEGGTAVFQLNELGLEISIAADARVTESFREHINAALLALLPGPTEIH